MADELSERLASLWVPGEVIVYIGLAGTSLRKRIDQYYATHLGARGPHAGGWPLKTLDLLGDLRVFVARCSEPSEAEQRMLAEFAQRVPVQVARHLRDPLRVMPFANLEYPKGNRKAHGISGAREPRAGGLTGAPPEQNASAPVFVTPAFTSGGRTTQRVTATDIASGRIRIPSRSKDIFPSDRARISIDLRGQLVTASWDPKFGPDKERSGTIAIPKAVLAASVNLNEVLSIRLDGSTHRLN